ncbi:MAG: LacI family DNA-binding transcriptional regulator [Ilumatobacteraceae bacterium]
MVSEKKNRRPVTMEDVAEKAGVAVSSVSRALSGHPDVSDELRKRVMNAAKKSGYQPNLVASSLRSGSTLTVGFIVRDISNPLFAWIAKGADETLREHGYSLLLTNSDGDSEIEVEHLNLLKQRRVDGIIASLVSEADSPVVKTLQQFSGSLVILDREVPELVASYIQINHRSGMRDAVRHLLQLGHRRISLITGPMSVRSCRERILGFEEAHKEMGMQVDRDLICSGSWIADYAQASVVRICAGQDSPTAFIAGGIQSTEGVLKGLMTLGRRIGKDVAFVACDDLPFFGLCDPTISVVTRDYFNFGQTAAEVLLNLFNGGPNEIRKLQTAYIARATSIPCLQP